MELSGVVKILLLCLLEYLTEVLLTELSGVALPLLLAVPTLLLYIFGLDFSTTSTSLKSLSSLSSRV